MSRVLLAMMLSLPLVATANLVPVTDSANLDFLHNHSAENHDHELGHGVERNGSKSVAKVCVPENKMKIFVGSESANPMTQELFMNILKSVAANYGEKIAALGGKLAIYHDWKNPLVNALATRQKGEWVLYFTGGLARHRLMTPDGFAMVACHELGHHMSGAPKKQAWASNEGQSDYFATAKCARFLWERQDNIKVLRERMSRGFKLDPIAAKACSIVWGNRNLDNVTQEQALCIRSVEAGIALGSVLADLGKQDTPSLKTRDKSVVKRTNHRHPKAQCRLDTMFAGAICKADKEISPSSTNPDTGYCSRSRGDRIGVRPLCWYKPGQQELGPRLRFPSRF